MAYITAEQVKTRRDLIKKHFPAKEGWKIRVNKNAHSSRINVIIQAGPIDLMADYTRREYYSISHAGQIDNHPEEVQEVLKKIYGVINQGNHDISDPMTDYFDVGWYSEIRVGEFMKPFELRK